VVCVVAKMVTVLVIFGGTLWAITVPYTTLEERRIGTERMPFSQAK
jgi:hypothetical protein